MFIPLNTLKTTYNMNIKGIIHVGAHHAEEKESYNQCGVENVVWIEGNDDLIPIIQEKLNNFNSNDQILNYLISDTNNEEVKFHITNNTQSSSILDFGKHKQYYPGIDFVKSVTKHTKTLKNIIDIHNINMCNYNMVNLDLQGVELRALKGLGEYINHIDYIYTEVNNDVIYQNNDLIVDIDIYLAQYNFKRVETVMLSEQWGDAFYLKIPQC